MIKNNLEDRHDNNGTIDIETDNIIGGYWIMEKIQINLFVHPMLIFCNFIRQKTKIRIYL
ncbi:hypothetical protein A0H76_1504 [Hepatospora eriocheir]|uniref:Uncharacterized protein n=1 Tax=Hepatospora eriocheir TaxID=1081669 RepID=A0A1X0QH87_9MICR|nr:hypothetical protein A0H76_1504 [Hepatospora eriocheir]